MRRIWRSLTAHPKAMTLAVALLAFLAAAPGTMFHG